MTPRSTVVTLSLRECEPGALPPVCCKCGAPATGETAVGFHWFSKTILIALLFSGPLFLILLMIFRKSRTASMPVCPEHEGVWNRGRAIILGTTVTCLVLMLIALLLADGPAARLASGLLLLVLLGLLVGLAIGFWVLSGGIQARLINDQEIILTRLHPDFVDAVENHSSERQAVYDALRPARNPSGPGA